jgi:pimeloyl-ACP methyl ester carboxylesterase
MEERVQIANKKNLKLSAVFHYPGKAVTYPAVILLHGFSGSKDEEHIKTLAYDLHKKGIAAVRFDMSGLGESEGSLEEDYRFSNFLLDIDAIYQMLASQVFIDHKSIGIVGHSMGGKAALIYAASNPAVRSVCAISSPSQMGDAAAFKNDLAQWKATGWLDRKSSQYGFLSFPYAFIKDAMKYDVRKIARSIGQPKLIIWGTADDTVLPSETEELYDFLDEPKEAMIVKGMDHHYKDDPNLVNNVNKKVVSFFKETL